MNVFFNIGLDNASPSKYNKIPLKIDNSNKYQFPPYFNSISKIQLPPTSIYNLDNNYF